MTDGGKKKVGTGEECGKRQLIFKPVTKGILREIVQWHLVPELSVKQVNVLYFTNLRLRVFFPTSNFSEIGHCLGINTLSQFDFFLLVFDILLSVAP